MNLLVKNPYEIIEEMKALGNVLMPYNYPITHSENEDEINVLKQRHVVIDGYDLILFYSKADFQERTCASVQIFGRYSIFLPFVLVTKIAKMFLGTKELSFTEIYKDNRKIYCWTLWQSPEGEAIAHDGRVEKCEHEGWSFNYVDSTHVNFH